MRYTKTVKKLLSGFTLMGLLLVGSVPAVAYATSTCGGGNGNSSVQVSIDIGCTGKGNPIADATFGIIRFLSDGVGLVIVGSIIMGGIQYSASSGDPQASNKAITRIRSSLIALLIFIFAYPILNYLIPSGFLR